MAREIDPILLTVDSLRKQMTDYFGSIPIDLSQTLDEIKNYIIRNEKKSVPKI